MKLASAAPLPARPNKFPVTHFVEAARIEARIQKSPPLNPGFSIFWVSAFWRIPAQNRIFPVGKLLLDR
jgi:hypothetical protein